MGFHSFAEFKKCLLKLLCWILILSVLLQNRQLISHADMIFIIQNVVNFFHKFDDTDYEPTRIVVLQQVLNKLSFDDLFQKMVSNVLVTIATKLTCNTDVLE